MWHLVGIPVTWFWRSKEQAWPGVLGFQVSGLNFIQVYGILVPQWGYKLSSVFLDFWYLDTIFFYVNARCHGDRNMLTKSSHGLEKEGICRIRLVTDLQWTGSYTVYLGVLFLSKLSNDPDFFGIAPILPDEAYIRYRSSSSSGFQCVKISKNIFQCLL